MNKTRHSFAGTLSTLAVALTISLTLVACSGDENREQGTIQAQEQAEEPGQASAQRATEAQQQSQPTSASATRQQQEQQVAAQQSEQAQQQQQQAQQEAAQEQQEQQAVPEGPETPSVSPSETIFENYEESVWAQTEADDTVTFALDADQASWALALNHARHGFQIDPDSVRAEEWINAQYYPYPFPDSDTEFGITLDLMPHPLSPDETHLLRIGLQAPLIERSRQVNVMFVADASGSMAEGNRIAVARAALQAIWASLDPDRDRAGMIQFSVDPIPSSFVPHTAPDSEFLQTSVDRLLPYYGTNVQAGLNLGVQLADDARQAWPDSDNYVILISDGVANVDATDPFAILETAAVPDDSNPLRLITIGVGIEHYNDVLLEQLAQYGNGWYYYLDSPEQAWVTFSRENWLRLSTPFADQTRAQIRWNPDTVRAWRVIGYENRRTDDESFADDRKEFAELQSGTAVTIFVELELTENARGDAESELNLGSLAVRWLTPRSDESNRQEATLAVGVDAEPDAHMQRGAIVALAADRYGSQDDIGEEETPEVHTALVELLDQFRQIDWPSDADEESIAQLLWLLEILVADTTD
ncbi:MAG: DUF3520 domain-containing protein [Chloroflexi bacterium]|nr:DUF3520 domain-containing protein [Chloroflexota bacterium]MYD15689.1 DUF3520 domain-containing protein [Chloroflexota bacterium]